MKHLVAFAVLTAFLIRGEAAGPTRVELVIDLVKAIAGGLTDSTKIKELAKVAGLVGPDVLLLQQQVWRFENTGGCEAKEKVTLGATGLKLGVVHTHVLRPVAGTVVFALDGPDLSKTFAGQQQ